MIRELNAGFQHPIDGELLDLLSRSPSGCRLQKLVDSFDTITRAGLMYRLLRLEALGIVRAERKPRNTTYFLSDKNNQPIKGAVPSEANERARVVEYARFLYRKACDALDNADQEDNELCLLMSNVADDLAGFVSGMELLMEAVKYGR